MPTDRSVSIRVRAFAKGAMVLSKGDVAFSLAASFDAAANATVDGSPAMGYTQLQSYLEHLPLELPRGAQFRGNITQLFRECAIRRCEKTRDHDTS